MGDEEQVETINIPQKARDEELKDRYGHILPSIESHLVSSQEWLRITEYLSSIIGIMESASITTGGGNDVDIFVEALNEKIKDEEGGILEVLLESTFAEADKEYRRPIEDLYADKQVFKVVNNMGDEISIPAIVVEEGTMKKEIFTSSSILIPIINKLLQGSDYNSDLAELLRPLKEEKIFFTEVIKSI